MIKTRYSYKRNKQGIPIKTICSVKHYDTVTGEFIKGAYGYAVCNTDSKDIPCKRAGRKIALERARKVFNTDAILTNKKSGFVMGIKMLFDDTKED